MTADLVRRLRDHADDNVGNPFNGTDVALLREAADEIERIDKAARAQAEENYKFMDAADFRREKAEARLAAAEKVVEAAREAQSFMPATCEHAEAFQRHPDNIWCAARHRHAIVDALMAYEKAYSANPEKSEIVSDIAISRTNRDGSENLNSVVEKEDE